MLLKARMQPWKILLLFFAFVFWGMFAFIHRNFRRCWFKNGWMRINKSSDSGNEEEKTRLLHQLRSWSADSGFFGRSKFVLKQIKKTLVFLFGVKGHNTEMELPLLSLKTQQSSINKFWKLIRMLLLFFLTTKKWTNLLICLYN